MSRSRKQNEELVLRLLHRHGPLTRGQLMSISGLSRTTLYDAVTSLVDDGAVTTTVPEEARRKRGRPVERVALSTRTGAIGIDFARQAVRVAAVNMAGEITGTAARAHDPEAPWEQRVDTAYRLAGTLTDLTSPPSAIGIGLVGPVAASDVGSATNDDHGRASALVRERFGVPVRLDGGARLAAFAEATWGAAAGARDVLYLQLSHSVGGGLVVAGALHRGTDGLSGEFGHITVDSAGAACRCGGRGCLETTASIEGVLRAYRAAGGTAETLADFLAALDADDRTARGVLAETGAQVGRALAAICNIVGPSVIVIGGELGPALVEPIRRDLNTNIIPKLRARTSLRVAELGDAGAAIGAVALCLDRPPQVSPDAGGAVAERNSVGPQTSASISRRIAGSASAGRGGEPRVPPIHWRRPAATVRRTSALPSP